MATTKKSPSKKIAKRNAPKRTARKAGIDAIALLKSDHREVEKLFAQFEKAKAPDRKRAIVGKFCDALTVHAKIEEEIFYPQARDALSRKGDDLLDEAEIEHEGIKRLVSELKNADPNENLYDARVTVLTEYVKHHVKEEEGDLFPKVKKSDLDTQKVGAELAARKEALSGKPVAPPPSLVQRGLRAIAGDQPAT
ncbi:MAG TPA: hemerythrin domain-containing protein [Rhizomicrobium sp.]